MRYRALRLMEYSLRLIVLILTAVTINAACSCGLEEKVGTLEVGKQADLVIWNAPDMEMLVYRMGSNLAKTVIKRGEVV